MLKSDDVSMKRIGVPLRRRGHKGMLNVRVILKMPTLTLPDSDTNTFYE